jgi:large subunit ribosomal protein L6
MHFIKLLPNIDVEFGKDWIKVKGSKGILLKKKSEDLELLKRNNKLYILTKDSKKASLFLKKFYSLMVGVTSGYTLKLRLVGVGYKASVQTNVLNLKVGFTHEVKFQLPENIEVYQPKSKLPLIVIFGLEYSKVAQVSANIRQIKEPEVYKGKGIRYFDEKIKWKKSKKVNG